MLKMDADGDGEITWEEFYPALSSWLAEAEQSFSDKWYACLSLLVSACLCLFRGKVQNKILSSEMKGHLLLLKHELRPTMRWNPSSSSSRECHVSQVDIRRVSPTIQKTQSHACCLHCNQTWDNAYLHRDLNLNLPTKLVKIFKFTQMSIATIVTSSIQWNKRSIRWRHPFKHAKKLEL